MPKPLTKPSRLVPGRLLTTLLVMAPICQPATAAAQSTICAGDCDGNKLVSTNELVQAVNIALVRAELDLCPSLDSNQDEQVTVDEIVTAVDEALNACPGQTARPTRTPTSPGPPTQTPTATTRCGNGMAEDQEECDDANTISGDGCDDGCRLEPGGNPCAGVATTAGTAVRAVLFAEDLDSPLWVTAPRLDPHRVFIVERPGVVRIVKDGLLLATAFLDIADRVKSGTRTSEQGLLGLAFHPDFESNGLFFVYYTNRSGNIVIARYTVTADPDDADENSEQILLTIDHPTFANHNGGQIVFGPDGYLYAGVGDGGSGGDPNEHGQSQETLLAKLLRLDVNVDEPPYYRVPPSNPNAAAGERLGLIWAIGLRNPWRFSFDRLTQDLYIADVGQDHWEEIDVQPAGSSGGENYGWDVFEGRHCFDPRPLFSTCPDPPTGYTMPVLEYDHDQGCSVTGGFVYRGCALPDLRGTYFYGDYCTAFIRSFRLADGVVADEHDWTEELRPAAGGPITAISSFGEDARGEIYVCDLDSGSVFKLVPGEAP